MKDIFKTPVEQLEKIGEGKDSFVYMLEFDGKKYVKKVPISERQTFWSCFQLRGRSVTDNFTSFYPDSDVKVPNIATIKGGETPYLVETFSEGVELQPELLNSLSRETRDSIALRLGQFISNLHSMPMRHISYDKSESDTSHAKAKRRLLKEKVCATLKRGTSHWAPSFSNSIVVNHGDIRPSNILYGVETDGLTAIDFSRTIRWGGKVEFNRIARQEKCNSGFPRSFTLDVLDAYNQSIKVRNGTAINPCEIKWPKIKASGVPVGAMAQEPGL